MKKQLAGILALAMSLTMAACSSDAGSGSAGSSDNGSGDADSKVTTTAAAVKDETTAKADDGDSKAEAEGDTEASQEEKQEPAEDVKYPTAMSMLRDVELENKEVKIITYNSDTVPQAAIELFEQKYGGTVAVHTTVTDNFNNADKLDKAIKDSKGIDLIIDYPQTMYGNVINERIQPVDSYIDLNSDIWQNTKTAMEAYSFGGKHYKLVTDVAPAYYCFYNTETIEEHGFDDPWELYKAGNWNWDTFESMLSDFLNEGNVDYGITGYYFGYALARSAGVPLAEVSGGHIVSNSGNQALKDAMNFGLKLNNNGLSFFDPWFADYAVSNVGDGGQLFCITFLGELRGGFNNFGVVPVPSPAGSDPYQYASVSGYSLYKDAQNPEGAALFAECIIAANNDPEVIAANNQNLKKNYDFSDAVISQLNEIDSLASRYPVIDFSDSSADFHYYTRDSIIYNSYLYGKASDLSIIDTFAAVFDEDLQAALAGME